MAQPTNQHRRRLVRRGIAAVCVVVTVGIIWQVASHSHTATSTKASGSAQAARAHVSTQNSAALQQIVTAWARQQTGQAGVHVSEVGGTAAVADYHADSAMVTASVYKLFVAYAVLHSIEQGSLALTTTLSSGQTVQTALSQMITRSDNASAEALGFKVGWTNINTLAASIGATHTNINNYAADGSYTSASKISTAHDVAALLSRLQAGTLVSASHTQLLLGLMKSQVWRERIPAGVPASIVVADKLGWLTTAEGDGQNVQNDAAIVYGPTKTYILVVMTTSATPQPLASLSSAVYAYLK